MNEWIQISPGDTQTGCCACLRRPRWRFAWWPVFGRRSWEGDPLPGHLRSSLGGSGSTWPEETKSTLLSEETIIIIIITAYLQHQIHTDVWTTYLVVQILDTKPLPEVPEDLRTVFFELEMSWKIFSVGETRWESEEEAEHIETDDSFTLKILKEPASLSLCSPSLQDWRSGLCSSTTRADWHRFHLSVTASETILLVSIQTSLPHDDFMSYLLKRWLLTLILVLALKSSGSSITGTGTWFRSFIWNVFETFHSKTIHLHHQPTAIKTHLSIKWRLIWFSLFYRRRSSLTNRAENNLSHSAQRTQQVFFTADIL